MAAAAAAVHAAPTCCRRVAQLVPELAEALLEMKSKWHMTTPPTHAQGSPGPELRGCASLLPFRTPMSA